MEIEFRVLANKNTKARQMATAVFMAFGSGIWFLEPHIYEFLGETSNFVWRQVLLPPQKQKKKSSLSFMSRGLYSIYDNFGGSAKLILLQYPKHDGLLRWPIRRNKRNMCVGQRARNILDADNTRLQNI